MVNAIIIQIMKIGMSIPYKKPDIIQDLIILVKVVTNVYQRMGCAVELHCVTTIQTYKCVRIWNVFIH